MRATPRAAVLAAFVASAAAAVAGLSTNRQGTEILVAGEHFRLTVDRARGGEITRIELFDGSAWCSVLGGDGQTCPLVTLSDGQNDYTLSNDRKARIESFNATSEKVRFEATGTPCAPDGARSPWTVKLTYEIYPEGAVFVDLDYELKAGEFAMAASKLGFVVDRALTRSPKYRAAASKRVRACFPSARVAFGKNPKRSFTNEIETMVEYRKPMAGKVGFQQKAGVFRWTLGGGGDRLKAPYAYDNRLSIGLGAAAVGKPRTNVVGQRVYHWVNWIDRKHWYPTHKQIDTMVANHGTMLILHHEWMKRRGSSGNPHANYAVARHHEEMVKSIAYAHRRGLRVGLYMRGVEQYGLDARFFEKYCKRHWDGIYVDWHGPLCVSYHENRYKPDPKFNDNHLSTDGHCLPGKAYFLFTKRLRQIVGAGGFLIGHMGSFNSGILANLVFDAYLPGEAGSDHNMLANCDESVYKGMMGGVVCMPWTLDAAKYRTPDGVARMAAWGLYPHLVLGIQRRRAAPLFTREPDSQEYRFILPYWRVLSHIDVERARVFNLPSRNVAAASSSNPDIHCLVYKEGDEAYLLVVANLGEKASSATITLARDVLGLFGDYKVSRIDSQTGRATSHGKSSGKITTSALPQWGIEGYKLQKANGKAK